MSLIQEALKRKLEEQQGGPIQAAAPPPPPTTRPSGPSKGGAFGRILGFLVAIMLLLSVAVALFYLAARKWNWQDALAEAKADAGQAQVKWEQAMEKARASAPEPAEEEPAEDVADAAPAAPSPLASVSDRVHSMKEKVQANHAEQAELVQGTSEAVPAPVAAVAAPEPAPVRVVAVEAEEAAPEPRRSKAKAASWPRITVNGILSSSKQGGGAAILNNRMVGANELIEGARVVEVQARGVMMEYKGETRLLLIGQTAD
jgi:hypothetical protein